MTEKSNIDGPSIRQKHSSLNKVLPPIGDWVRNQKRSILRYIDLDGIEQVVDYGKLCEADDWPIPMPVDREGYGTVDTSFQYWATGYGDWLNVNQATQRHCVSPIRRLLDFGCATGRFLRHVHFFSDVEPHGCDFAPANVEWVAKHFGGAMNVVSNSAEPKLPYDDGYFDCVTAFSVFTHIDREEEEWLRELVRITAPQGLLYLTIQNQASWDKVLKRPGSFEHLERANKISGNLLVDESLFNNPMPENRIVFRMSNDKIYNCNVWTSDEHVKAVWTKQAKLIRIAPNAHTNFQSVVILQPIA